MSLLEKPLYAPALSKDARASGKRAAAARTAYAKDKTTLTRSSGSRGADALGLVGDFAGDADPRRREQTRRAAPLARGGRGLIAIRKFEAAVKELKEAAETLAGGVLCLGDRHSTWAAGLSARARGLHQGPDPGVFAYLADARAGSSAMPRPKHLTRSDARPRRRRSAARHREKPGPPRASR